MIPDGITWEIVATAFGTILAALIAFIINNFIKRLDAHEVKDTTLFTKIFDKQSELVETVAGGFRGLDNTINTIHVKLLEQMNKPHHRADD